MSFSLAPLRLYFHNPDGKRTILPITKTMPQGCLSDWKILHGALCHSTCKISWSCSMFCESTGTLITGNFCFYQTLWECMKAGDNLFFWNVPNLFFIAAVECCKYGLYHHPCRINFNHKQSQTNDSQLMERKKITIEFLLRASPAILYQFFTTPSNLVRWFCDGVDVQPNGIYAF